MGLHHIEIYDIEIKIPATSDIYIYTYIYIYLIIGILDYTFANHH